MVDGNKWKTPTWLVPGARATVARGRIVPKGTQGTILKSYSTGSGPKAYLYTGPEAQVQQQIAAFSSTDPRAIDWAQIKDVWVRNLDPR